MFNNSFFSCSKKSCFYFIFSILLCLQLFFTFYSTTFPVVLAIKHKEQKNGKFVKFLQQQQDTNTSCLFHFSLIYDGTFRVSLEFLFVFPENSWQRILSAFLFFPFFSCLNLPEKCQNERMLESENCLANSLENLCILTYKTPMYRNYCFSYIVSNSFTQIYLSLFLTVILLLDNTYKDTY